MIGAWLGVAQLVARSVRDAEVVSSSLITQTSQNMNETQKKRFFVFVGTVAVVVALFFLWFFVLKEPATQLFSNRENIVKFVRSKGALGPVFYILLHIAQTIVAPIPGNIVGAIGGFLFGSLGSLWTTIGSTTGVFIVFVLARKFGRGLALKLTGRKDFGKLDNIPEEKAATVFFLIFLIPGLPDDIVSYAAGLSKVPLGQLVILWMIGRFPAVIMTNMIGAGIEEGNLTLVAILLGVSAIIVGIVTIKRRELSSFLEAKTKKH